MFHAFVLSPIAWRNPQLRKHSKVAENGVHGQPFKPWFKAPKRHVKKWHIKECSSDPGSSNKNGRNSSGISRGRWPCGRRPPVKGRTPFPENIKLAGLKILDVGGLRGPNDPSKMVGLGLGFEAAKTPEVDDLLSQN